jgi:hypothetical protein
MAKGASLASRFDGSEVGMMLDTSTYPSGIREILDQNPMVGDYKRGARRAWTNKEIATLKAVYPASGISGCIPALPGRSATSIYQHAAAEGLRAPRGKSGAERQRWTSSPQVDAIITRAYQGTPTKGDIKSLARTANRPLWWICKRAAKLGLSRPRFKEPRWADAEMEFVASNAHKDADAIARMLKRRGFNRTATAVSVKLKRLGTPTGKNADLNHYTANQLAGLFGVDRKGVGAWIAKGWLTADRRGTARVAEQGGDEYWIHRRAVRKFIIENIAAIDVRKVEKFWFVELLTQEAA